MQHMISDLKKRRHWLKKKKNH